VAEFDMQDPYPVPMDDPFAPFPVKPNGHTNPTLTAAAAEQQPPINPPQGRAAKLRKKRGGSAEGGVAGEGKVQTKLEVRTAGKKWWWRAHRDADYQVPADLLVIEGGRDEGIYLLEPDVEYPDELAEHITPVILTRCITSDGTQFLFKAGQSEKSPTSSTRRLITEARERWIQSSWNGNSKSYDFRYANQLRKEPIWQAQTMDELLDLAFNGKILDNPCHEVVNRLLFPDDEDGVSQ
jgi:hypothetical protein